MYYVTQVDFTAFADDVQSRQSATGSGPSVSRSALPAAGRGIELYRAVASVSGAPVYDPAEWDGDSGQAALARSAAPEINRLFNEFDTGVKAVKAVCVDIASRFILTGNHVSHH